MLHRRCCAPIFSSAVAPIFFAACVALCFSGGFARSASAQVTGVLDLYKITYPGGYLMNTSVFAPVAPGGQWAASVYGSATGNNYHAVVWSPPAGNFADLNPTGIDYSRAMSAAAGVQVGFGRKTSNAEYHAYRWSGSAASATDINPTTFTYSQANFIGADGTIVGFGAAPSTGTVDHALLWTAANSVVDLNGTNISYSFAYGAGGGDVVGDGEHHALLWKGPAHTFVNLQPAKFTYSSAQATDGAQQVGYAYNNGNELDRHAIVWSDAYDTAVDLAPTGYDWSTALAVRNGVQVGGGYTTGASSPHALMWSGSADSLVDLHSYLPAKFIASYAHSIDGGGNIFGYAYDGTSYEVVEWTVLPEPTSGAILALATVGILCRRSRARLCKLGG